MGKKLAAAAAFVLVGFVLLNGLGQAIISFRLLHGLIRWRDVAEIIPKSRRKIPGTVVVLGDSVARQLFPPSSCANSLAINGAVLMCGQYILAYNALECNPQLRYVVLVVNPQAIGFGFERAWTYSSFIKPFYTPANIRHFSKLIWSKMDDRPLSYFAILPLVKAARCFSDIHFPKPAADRGFFSDISLEYLQKIDQLAAAHGAQLIVLSPPVRASRRNTYLERMRPAIVANHLEPLFRQYFERLIFVDDRHFHDSVHLRNAYLAENRLDFCKRILPTLVWSKFMRYAGAGAGQEGSRPAAEEKADAGEDEGEE
jgi:hypothetical protein